MHLVSIGQFPRTSSKLTSIVQPSTDLVDLPALSPGPVIPDVDQSKLIFDLEDEQLKSDSKHSLVARDPMSRSKTTGLNTGSGNGASPSRPKQKESLQEAQLRRQKKAALRAESIQETAVLEKYDEIMKEVEASFAKDGVSFNPPASLKQRHLGTYLNREKATVDYRLPYSKDMLRTLLNGIRKEYKGMGVKQKLKYEYI